jgi:hypothetical protein
VQDVSLCLTPCVTRSGLGHGSGSCGLLDEAMPNGSAKRARVSAYECSSVQPDLLSPRVLFVIKRHRRRVSRKDRGGLGPVRAPCWPWPRTSVLHRAGSKTNRALLEPDYSYDGNGQLGGGATLFPIHTLPGGDDFLGPFGIAVNSRLGAGGRVIAEQLAPEECRLDQHRADLEGGDLWRERLHPDRGATAEAPTAADDGSGST